MRFILFTVCLLLAACKKENPQPGVSRGGGQSSPGQPIEVSTKKLLSSRTVITGDTLFYYLQISNNQYAYDSLGRLVAIFVIDSSKFNLVSNWQLSYYTEEFEYNAMGLISRIRTPFQGQIMEVNYNYSGSLITSQVSQYANNFDTISYEHKNARIIGHNNSTGAKYYYSGNLDSIVSQSNGQWSSTIRYLYNNRADLTAPLGRQKAMGKTFCPLNSERVQEIVRTASGTYSASISRIYNAEGLPVKRTEGKTVTTYKFEN